MIFNPFFWWWYGVQKARKKISTGKPVDDADSWARVEKYPNEEAAMKAHISRMPWAHVPLTIEQQKRKYDAYYKAIAAVERDYWYGKGIKFKPTTPESFEGRKWTMADEIGYQERRRQLQDDIARNEHRFDEEWNKLMLCYAKRLGRTNELFINKSNMETEQNQQNRSYRETLKTNPALASLGPKIREIYREEGRAQEGNTVMETKKSGVLDELNAHLHIAVESNRELIYRVGACVSRLAEPQPRKVEAGKEEMGGGGVINELNRRLNALESNNELLKDILEHFEKLV